MFELISKMYCDFHRLILIGKLSHKENVRIYLFQKKIFADIDDNSTNKVNRKLHSLYSLSMHRLDIVLRGHRFCSYLDSDT